jgi:hypothetical protein|nr:MAG TPA: hypothetical protein [Caudoviricetes sp.]
MNEEKLNQSAEPLTQYNSGFRSDEKIEITGEEFAIASASIERLFNQNIKQVRLLTYRYWQGDDIVLSPKQEDIDSGKVTKVFDPVSFMAANNVVEAYVGDPSAIVMKALENRFIIHERGIEAGKAVPIQTLIDEMEKSKLEVVPNE